MSFGVIIDDRDLKSTPNNSSISKVIGVGDLYDTSGQKLLAKIDMDKSDHIFNQNTDRNAIHNLYKRASNLVNVTNEFLDSKIESILNKIDSEEIHVLIEIANAIGINKDIKIYDDSSYYVYKFYPFGHIEFLKYIRLDWDDNGSIESKLVGKVIFDDWKKQACDGSNNYNSDITVDINPDYILTAFLKKELWKISEEDRKYAFDTILLEKEHILDDLLEYLPKYKADLEKSIDEKLKFFGV